MRGLSSGTRTPKHALIYFNPFFFLVVLFDFFFGFVLVFLFGFILFCFFKFLAHGGLAMARATPRPCSCLSPGCPPPLSVMVELHYHPGRALWDPPTPGPAPCFYAALY